MQRQYSWLGVSIYVTGLCICEYRTAGLGVSTHSTCEQNKKGLYVGLCICAHTTELGVSLIPRVSKIGKSFSVAGLCI